MTSATTGHIPVLRTEVLDLLLPEDCEPARPYLFVDATLGGGGHTRAMIERYLALYGQASFEQSFRLLGIDQDAGILEHTQRGLLTDFPTLASQGHFIHGNFSKLPDYLAQTGLNAITGGLLADIGVSSFQLDQAERGFSFNKNAPLDMRMDTTQELTAAGVVNTYSEKRLVEIFSEYGEERFSKTIARLICERRGQQSFKTTIDLAEMIQQLNRQKLGGKPQRIHPATRVFQALRIEVNSELQHLEKFLDNLPNLMASGARALVISFHSLEDRIVKHTFKALCPKDADFRLLSKKPIMADDEETQSNTRSRSAKLRGIEKK